MKISRKSVEVFLACLLVLLFIFECFMINDRSKKSCAAFLKSEKHWTEVMSQLKNGKSTTTLKTTKAGKYEFMTLSLDSKKTWFIITDRGRIVDRLGPLTFASEGHLANKDIGKKEDNAELANVSIKVAMPD